MKIVVITNCSKKKKLKTDSLLGSKLTPSSIREVAEEWCYYIKSGKSDTLKAKDMYLGRSYSEIKSIEYFNNFDWYIISAGLGFISSESKIPSYDLTVTKGSPNSIFSKTENNDSFKEWWSNVNYFMYQNKSPISDLINKNPNNLYLIALTKNYFNLISDDIKKIHNKENLRFFGFVNTSNLEDSLKQIFLPYNSSFDGPDSDNNGTKNDYPCRTLKHYIKEIYSKLEKPNFNKESEMIKSYLKNKRQPIKKTIIRLTNDEILKIIRKHKNEYPTFTKFLPFFRKKLGMSCEELRLKNLFNEALLIYFKGKIVCRN